MVFHEPVLRDEVIHYLMTQKDGIYVDGTVGGGGHAEAIVQNLEPEGRLVGIDLDGEALQFAQNRLRSYMNQITLKQGNFKELGQILEAFHIEKVHGILLDLGVSSHQIDTGARGFSFSADGPLDMRMNPGQNLSAFEIINQSSEDELVEIFRSYGEERHSRKIARKLIKEREKSTIRTTQELREIIGHSVPHRYQIKSFARIFQALRLAVNDELRNLSEVLRTSLEWLSELGRLVVISYHSLEDRLVKDFFKKESARCVCPPELPVCVCGKKGTLNILTKRVVRPSEEEVRRNPRSRSAKLRAAERLSLAQSE